jgi:hypothetical protein
MRQDEPAMQLPPGVAPERGAVAGIVMARRLALRPVAEIVKADHADRPSHSDQRAEIDAQTFEPKRAVEARMNESPVHADRMPETQRHRAGRDEKQEGVPRKQKRPERDSRQSHGTDP